MAALTQLCKCEDRLAPWILTQPIYAEKWPAERMEAQRKAAEAELVAILENWGF